MRTALALSVVPEFGMSEKLMKGGKLVGRLATTSKTGDITDP
jgi:hypothetical protein